MDSTYELRRETFGWRSSCPLFAYANPYPPQRVFLGASVYGMDAYAPSSPIGYRMPFSSVQYNYDWDGFISDGGANWSFNAEADYWGQGLFFESARDMNCMLFGACGPVAGFEDTKILKMFLWPTQIVARLGTGENSGIIVASAQLYCTYTMFWTRRVTSGQFAGLDVLWVHQQTLMATASFQLGCSRSHQTAWKTLQFYRHIPGINVQQPWVPNVGPVPAAIRGQVRLTFEIPEDIPATWFEP